jgi:hypothetical protein
MLSSSQQTLQALKAWQNHVWLLQPRFVPTISGGNWKLYIKMFVQQYKTSELGTSCLEIAGLDPMFFIRLFGFIGGRCDALLDITIIWYNFSFYGESVSGECHGSQDLRTGNGGSSLYGKVELPW